MKRIILSFFLFVLLGFNTTFAFTSGACSGHGGVSCNSGMDYDGSVICSDGWKDSTVLYPEVRECSEDNPYKNLSEFCSMYGVKNGLTIYKNEYDKSLQQIMSQYDQSSVQFKSPSIVNPCQGIEFNQCYSNMVLDKSGLLLDQWKQYNDAHKVSQDEYNKQLDLRDYYLKNTAHPKADSEAFNNTEAICLAGDVSTSTATTVKSTPVFIDVTGGIYFDAIKYVKDNGIVEGYPDGSYKPNNKINRAEFTKILMEAAFKDQNSTFIESFPDIPVYEWYAYYIALAKEKGVISGYKDGTFKPNNNIIAAEALKITLEAFYDNIPDVKGEWYQKYWSLATSKKILITAWGKVDQEITRGEMAQLIYNIKNSN